MKTQFCTVVDSDILQWFKGTCKANGLTMTKAIEALMVMYASGSVSFTMGIDSPRDIEYVHYPDLQQSRKEIE